MSNSRQCHDPTDWVIANYPWPPTSCTASGLTETARRPSLLRLRPDDHALGLGSPVSRLELSSPGRVDGQESPEQRHDTEQSVKDDDDDENLLIYHQHQQQRGNHDNELVIDPLVSSSLFYSINDSYMVACCYVL